MLSSRRGTGGGSGHAWRGIIVVGIPRELKPQKHRIAATPGAVRALTASGHQVLVQAGAGVGTTFEENAFLEADAVVVAGAAEAWSAGLVHKDKEPVAPEYGFLRSDPVLFTFLQLVADGDLTRARSMVVTTAIGYESVQLDDGALPLLTPMSEVAGHMAPHSGAMHLARSQGGRGVLLGSVPGVEVGAVTVLGANVLGTSGARTALGLGALVTILDIRHARLQYLDDVFRRSLQTLASTPANIADTVAHDDPTYVVDGVSHYGVANMPGAVPNTSNRALSYRTLGYSLQLAGCELGVLEDAALLRGLSTLRGRLTYAPVGWALGPESTDARGVLAARRPGPVSHVAAASARGGYESRASSRAP